MPESTELKDVLKVEERKREDGTIMPKLTLKELQARARDIERLEQAKEQRDCAHKEFDGMDYLTHYETNQQADNSYIPPKLNKQDVRVVTGTTREKDNSLLSALLNYNFEAAITAYDKEDNEITELGATMEDLVRKSREIEDYDSKRDLIYRELLAQGDVFALEEWYQKTRFDRKATFNWQEGVNFSTFKVDSTLKMDFERAQVTLYPGTKVYKGDMRNPFMEGQPFVFTLETVPYDVARQQFMRWERWKNVPRTVAHLVDPNNDTEYRDWTLLEGQQETVEMVKVFDEPNNTFQLYLSGVPMLPVDFPLTEISPSGKTPLVQGSCERIPFFAYSKGMPSKTKVEQAVIDELTKMAVIKSQQAYNPALANNTNRTLSAGMWLPGTVTDDIDPEKLQPLFPQNGVTQADMAFLQYMKQIIDSKSVSAAFAGEQTDGSMTATQVIEQKKQQLVKLGLVVWGVVQFEKRLSEMRIYTIAHSWTKAPDPSLVPFQSSLDGALRRVTVESTFENGQQGRKIYDFNEQKANSVTPEQLQIEEELLSLREGRPIRKVYINPSALRNLKAVWRINVTPTEKETSDLHRVMFVQNVRDAALLFGPQSLNMDYIKDRFAQLIKESRDKFFVREQQALPMQAPGMEGVGGEIAQQMGNAVVKPTMSNVARG